MRKTWNEYFMDLAVAAASRSTCPRRHVGAVIVDFNNSVIATGYNGSRPGEDHCDDVGCLEIDGSCKRTIHAEINAIKRSKRWSRRHSRLYTTDFPCLTCAQAIIRAGITEVFYKNPYKRTEKEVLALFEEEGIVISQ